MNKRNIVQIFAENIMALRKKKGFSQYDLAQLTGISRRMICHYETEGMIPPGDRLQALANALDVPVAKLFEEKNIEPNDPVDLTNIDSRSVKKLKDILSLPSEDRNDLYRILNKLVRKNQLEKQQKKQ
jgi:transcriptional regulator with XRE-family HTH domain